MKVKICGLTNFHDAALALELGATELGFILAKSPRQIDLNSLISIIEKLPAEARTVGVFVDETPLTILKIVKEAKLKAVQLHGNETNADLEFLKKQLPCLVIFKVIGVKENIFNLNPDLYTAADAIIFDVVGSHFEPEGRKPIESELLKSFKSTKPFYIAGGLTATNIQSKIIQYKPNGVDLSSGVEKALGLKDTELLKELFSKLKDQI